MNDTLPIPQRLNLALLALALAGVGATWAAPTVLDMPVWLAAVAFGALMQPAYGLLHECMHDIFNRRRWLNDAAGLVLSVFLPSSFRLIRYVHRGHHMSNRSKRERIEYVADGESRFAKGLLYYGILLGLNWLAFVLQNLAFTLLPNAVIRRLKLDTDFGATLPTLGDAELRRIALEFASVIALHAGALVLTPLTLHQYGAFMLSNALFYSQLRYIYHYEAGFDVIEGAFDLKTPRLLSWLALNGTYHLTHHRTPKVPWVHLQRTANEADQKHSVWSKLIGQWKGVVAESTQPVREGRVIDWNRERML